MCENLGEKTILPRKKKKIPFSMAIGNVELTATIKEDKETRNG